MIVMAVEAVKQLAMADHRPISGFSLKQGQLLAPITVGETTQEATETDLHLRPMIRAYEKESKWFEARLFSYRDGRWTENFRAEVQVQFEEKHHAGEVDGGQEAHLYHERVRQHAEAAAAQCADTVGADDFYRFVADHGSHLGDSFAHLDGIRWDGASSTGAARIDMASARKHYRPIDGSPVHPAVLDATLTHLQTSYITRGLVDQASTLVPQHFASLWISAKVWDQETSTLRVVSEIRKSRRAISTSTAIPIDVYALADDGSPLAIAEGLGMAEVSRASGQDRDEVSSDNPLLYGIAWKPQLSALSSRELQALCDAAALTRDDDTSALVSFLARLSMAMDEAARKALRTVQPEHLEHRPAYFHRYMASLQHQLGGGPAESDDGKPEAMSNEALEVLLQQCEAERPGWRLFPAIARSLGSVLRGEVNPMELFFSEAVGAGEFYSELFQIVTDDGRFSHFLDLATHENPGLKVLEVGAGTGGMTRQ